MGASDTRHLAEAANGSAKATSRNFEDGIGAAGLLNGNSHTSSSTSSTMNGQTGDGSEPRQLSESSSSPSSSTSATRSRAVARNATPADPSLARLTPDELETRLQLISVEPEQGRPLYFANWARTFACRPSKMFVPRTEEDCSLILEAANRAGARIRAVGVGHSPSDIGCTREWMLKTEKLDKVLKVRE
jgi:hypothetical protein